MKFSVPKMGGGGWGGRGGRGLSKGKNVCNESPTWFGQRHRDIRGFKNVSFSEIRVFQAGSRGKLYSTRLAQNFASIFFTMDLLLAYKVLEISGGVCVFGLCFDNVFCRA